MLSFLLAHLMAFLFPNRRGRPTLRVGTRDSVLAMAQTKIVEDFLRTNFSYISIETTSLKTAGDKNTTAPPHQMERKALWTEELEILLERGEVDMIVHSLKDMPTQLPPKCSIGAILSREDPRDALVIRADLQYTSLASLPVGAVIGTSSVRRTAQLRRLYPHLVIKDMRGNVPSRLRKLDDVMSDYDGIILAAAGLLRLGLEDRITQHLEAPEMLHAVGQGAIAVETRDSDEEVMEFLRGLRCDRTTKACLAERALLRKLEGGCSVPIGVKTTWTGENTLKMQAVVASVDGTQAVDVVEIQDIATDDEAEIFGVFVAGRLWELGAGPILAAIEAKKPASKAV